MTITAFGIDKLVDISQDLLIWFATCLFSIFVLVLTGFQVYSTTTSFNGAISIFLSNCRVLFGEIVLTAV